MFGSKRKARKIQVSEEHEDPTASSAGSDESTNDGKPFLFTSPVPRPFADLSVLAPKNQLADAPPSVVLAPGNTSSVKFTRRPAKSSSLRKSIHIDDDAPHNDTSAAAADQDDDDGPAVIRPAGSRSGSTRLKKKGSSSRLSFGVTEDADGDGDAAAAAAAQQQPFTPKKNPSATTSLSQRATENSALRASLSSRKANLPTRSFGAEQQKQPVYSREYLDELQSSTPNTPRHPDKPRTTPPGDGGDDDDDTTMMDLDASELDGAVVVPAADLAVSSSPFGHGPAGHIPSAAEIREKKERRARMAKEGDAYEDDEYDDDDGFISLAPKKKKDDTRLMAEDEDLGEGYDEYVEDGRLELGKSREKAARRRHRREMEELINAAEGASEAGEDADSDAERTAAYEAAQTRAAMDGLHRAAVEDADPGGRLVIPKMKPLPDLGVSLARLRELVGEVEAQAAQKRKRIEAIEKEKQEILDREKEVQAVLNQAGMKYQSAMGIQSATALDPETLAAQSPLRNTQICPEERGLESFGTPTRKTEEEDGPGDMGE